MGSKPKQPTFEEALDRPEYALAEKEKKFLKTFLKEMKLERRPPVIGRSEELKAVVKAVGSPRGVISSVVLIGDAGVGKTAVVEKLAQALAQGEGADGSLGLRSMEGRYLVELDAGQLLNQDDPVGALSALIGMLGKLNDPDPSKGNKVVVFIDEIHQLFLSSHGERIANLLKKPLRDGGLALIAATTTKEYKKHLESDDAFKRRLKPVWVAEPSIEETLQMLQGAKAYYEKLLGVTFSEEADKAAAELSKYDQENHLPGRAFTYWIAGARRADRSVQQDELSLEIEKTLRELSVAATAAAKQSNPSAPDAEEAAPAAFYNKLVELSSKAARLYAKRQALAGGGPAVVGAEEVKAEIAEATKIGAGQLTLGQEKMDKYLKMEEALGKKVLGQPEAVAAISEAIRRNKAGLSASDRPTGVFYLTGPTGTGKTLLAKELAQFLGKGFIRLDMSEYMQEHETSKMIGSPPGYVGYGQGGQLTEAVRRRPDSVVLIDEIEKAHPKVFDLLLQILGEGRLTDGEGRTIDFKNTIVLMTSNIGMSEVDLASYERAWQDIRRKEEEYRQAGKLEKYKDWVAQQKAELSQRLASEARGAAIESTERAMRERYRPEFKGRIDEVLVFNRLSPGAIAGVARQHLDELAAVLDKAGHKLEYDASAAAYLADKGYSITLGARPIQNLIRQEVAGPIARKILEASGSGELARTTLKLKASGGGLSIEVSARPEQPVSRLQSEEGAGRLLFERVFAAVLRSAASGAALDLGVETLDRLAQECFDAAKGGAQHKLPTPSNDAREAPKTPPLDSAQGKEPGPPSSDEPPQASNGPAPAGPALFSPRTGLVLGPAAKAVVAANNDAEAKDPHLKTAARELEAAMEEAGYDEDSRDAVVRWQYSALKTTQKHLGFLKLFGAHAKAFTPIEYRGEKLKLAWEASRSGVKLVLTRAGAMSAQEADRLAAHFTGPAPLDHQDSFRRAEARNAAQARLGRPEDGKQTYFELYRALNAVPGSRLGWNETGGSVQYWLELPGLPEPEAKPAEQAAPEASPAGSAQRAGFKKYLIALLRQSEGRGLTLRLNAAEALAQVSGPEDLVLARDWIRLENMREGHDKLAAAALILARHGGAEDFRSVLAAGRRLDPQYGHDYNPSKALVAEALARMMAPGDAAQKEKLERDYVRGQGLGRHSGREQVQLEAQYLAYAASAEASGKSLLESGANGAGKIRAYFDFLKRTTPSALVELLAKFRSGENLDERQKALAALTAAELGDRDDLSRMLAALSQRTGGYQSQELAELPASSFARLAERLGAWDQVRGFVRQALGSALDESSNYRSALTAVLAAGALGGPDELPLLEAMLRVDSGSYRDLNNIHEVTQHEAAMAWAKIVVRSGLLARMLQQTRDGRGMPQASTIETMLGSTHPMLNLAAQEALRLKLGLPAPERRPGYSETTESPANARDPQGVFRLELGQKPPYEGREHSTWFLPLDEAARQDGSKLSLMTNEDRHLFQRFVSEFSHLLEPIFRQARGGHENVGVSQAITEYAEGGRRYVVFGLRPAVTLPALGEGWDVELAHDLRAALTDGLEPEHQVLRSFIARLQSRGGASLGYSDQAASHTTGQREFVLWLAFELAAPAAPEAVRPSAPPPPGRIEPGWEHPMFPYDNPRWRGYMRPRLH